MIDDSLTRLAPRLEESRDRMRALRGDVLSRATSAAEPAQRPGLRGSRRLAWALPTAATLVAATVIAVLALTPGATDDPLSAPSAHASTPATSPLTRLVAAVAAGDPAGLQPGQVLYRKRVSVLEPGAAISGFTLETWNLPDGSFYARRDYVDDPSMLMVYKGPDRPVELASPQLKPWPTDPGQLVAALRANPDVVAHARSLPELTLDDAVSHALSTMVWSGTAPAATLAAAIEALSRQPGFSAAEDPARHTITTTYALDGYTVKQTFDARTGAPISDWRQQVDPSGTTTTQTTITESEIVDEVPRTIVAAAEAQAIE